MLTTILTQKRGHLRQYVSSVLTYLTKILNVQIFPSRTDFAR